MQYQQNLKTHTFASVWVVWPVGEFLEKGINKKIFVIFHLSDQKPPWTDFDQILHSSRSCGRNHVWQIFSARCNIYISRLCYVVSVRLSVRLFVTEVHWRIISNLGFKFRSQFTRIVVAGRGNLNNNISRYASHCYRPSCWQLVKELRFCGTQGWRDCRHSRRQGAVVRDNPCVMWEIWVYNVRSWCIIDCSTNFTLRVALTVTTSTSDGQTLTEKDVNF